MISTLSLSAIKNRKTLKQLFYYGIVGICSNTIGYTIYLLATYLGSSPKLTMSLLYGVGVIVSFLGNRKLTFEQKGRTLNVTIRYLIAQCVGYLINLMILIVMVDKLGYAHQWVQAIAVFIVAFFLFCMYKLFVFKNFSH